MSEPRWTGATRLVAWLLGVGDREGRPVSPEPVAPPSQWNWRQWVLVGVTVILPVLLIVGVIWLSI